MLFTTLLVIIDCVTQDKQEEMSDRGFPTSSKMF